LNALAEELTGWSEAEAKGRPCSKVFRITNQETGCAVESRWIAYCARDVVGLANHTILTSRKGAKAPHDDSGAPIRDSQGNLFGVVLVFRDVTEQRQGRRNPAAPGGYRGLFRGCYHRQDLHASSPVGTRPPSASMAIRQKKPSDSPSPSLFPKDQPEELATICAASETASGSAL